MLKYEILQEEVNAAARYATKLIKAGKRGAYTNYLIGTLGEMGYAKHTNSKVNLEVYARGVGDKGMDFSGVQVKTATWPYANKELKVNENDKSLTNPKVKKYVLMHVNPENKNVAYLVGEISKENFLKKAKYSSHYECYVVSEYDLDVIF